MTEIMLFNGIRELRYWMLRYFLSNGNEFSSQFSNSDLIIDIALYRASNNFSTPSPPPRGNIPIISAI